MKKPLRVLIVEDSESAALSLLEKLHQAGFDPSHKRVQSADAMRQALEQRKWDIVFCDYSMPDFSGSDALQVFKSLSIDIPFIIISGDISEETARELMMAGAHDYLKKDNLTRLIPVVYRELKEASVRRDQRRTHKALEQNERLFRTMLEAAPSATIIANMHGQITLVNERTEHMFGYTRQALLGTTIRKLIPAYSVDAVDIQHADELADLIYNKTDVSLELFGEHKDGAGFPVEVRYSFVRADHGVFMINFVTDITVRKKNEEQIRSQASLLDQAQDAIVEVDLESKIHYWNKGAERLFGWTREEAIAYDAGQILFNKLSTSLQSARYAVEEHGIWEGELKHTHRDGHELIVHNRWTLLRDASNRPRSILFIGTDQTEKKRLEDQFLRVQRLETIGALVGGMAHDLNNILTPIQLSTQMLKIEDDDPARSKMYNTIEKNVKRGAEMLMQVLKFGQSTTGEQIQMQPRFLIKEVLKFVGELFPKSIESKAILPRELWKISCDPTQFYQVVFSLCRNACAAMENHGTLTVTAENVTVSDLDAQMHSDIEPGSYVVIGISDTGVGIPQEELPTLFQANGNSTAAQSRWQTNLSVIQSILQKHHGHIVVMSEEGMGASFNLYFPATTSFETSDSGAQTTNWPAGNSQTVLVVDDEAYIRSMLGEILELFNYKVLTAVDGREAIEAYEAHVDEVDVVLMDMSMPNMNGADAIQILKEKDPQLNIIAASGLPENDIFNGARDKLVKSFLLKPYTAEKILTALNKLFAS